MIITNSIDVTLITYGVSDLKVQGFWGLQNTIKIITKFIRIAESIFTYEKIWRVNNVLRYNI